MDRKKRIRIQTTVILLLVIGFLCIAIAAWTQGHIDDIYVNVIGFSSFGFWGFSLVLLLCNFTTLFTSELDDFCETLQQQDDFFIEISMEETPQTLKERFEKVGFHPVGTLLYKREILFLQDCVHSYLITVQDQDCLSYFESFIETSKELLLNKKHKNNVFYLVFFINDIAQEQLQEFQEFSIVQSAFKQLPISLDTVFPIVYDTTNKRYILQKAKAGVSFLPLQHALKRFYKIIGVPVKHRKQT